MRAGCQVWLKQSLLRRFCMAGIPNHALCIAAVMALSGHSNNGAQDMTTLILFSMFVFPVVAQVRNAFRKPAKVKARR